MEHQNNYKVFLCTLLLANKFDLHFSILLSDKKSETYYLISIFQVPKGSTIK